MRVVGTGGYPQRFPVRVDHPIGLVFHEARNGLGQPLTLNVQLEVADNNPGDQVIQLELEVVGEILRGYSRGVTDPTSRAVYAFTFGEPYPIIN